MSRIIPINEPVVPAEFGYGSGWRSFECKFHSRGKVCTLNNKQYVIVIKKAKDRLGIGKICVVIAAILLTCGLICRSTRFKNWAMKQTHSEKVRFAIPVDNFTKLQAMPQREEIAKKLADLNSFYRDHYIKTNNDQAIDDIIRNCVARATTMQDLCTIIRTCHEGGSLSNSAIIFLKEKFLEFGVNAGKLSDVVYVKRMLEIQDPTIDNEIVERMLTERHDLTGYYSYRSLVVERFSVENNHLVENLSPLIPEIRNSDNNYAGDVTVKAVKLVLTHHTPSPALDKASVYVITNAGLFASTELEIAVKHIISKKVRCKPDVYKMALTYLLLNKGKFSPEITFQAVTHYQTLTPCPLIDAQIKTLYNLV